MMPEQKRLPDHLNGTGTTRTGELLEYGLLDESQLDAIWELEQQAHSYPWTRKLFGDCLGVRQPCVVVYNRAQIVGYAVVSAAAGNAELLNLVVAPNSRRQGIAHALMRHVIGAVASYADTLYLEVRQSNAPAIALYEEIGFVEVGIRPNYYPAAKGREDALILAYTL
ncbi:ribosomal protein S18-alanine N-acetyltransferase [Gilvimarinus polysaccharolyticus]|uniref:ribosomal protein S18-alanine N-acetyltransferase n=1 Tax=Gilvimarinus polysaccharolyticus TaxID=863921 RepID=UPI000673926B|nr:ribosomal protein S18-alanine N-acetyltransferase [Gilvimarinus polysaccharolyticus]